MSYMDPKIKKGRILQAAIVGFHTRKVRKNLRKNIGVKIVTASAVIATETPLQILINASKTGSAARAAWNQLQLSRGFCAVRRCTR